MILGSFAFFHILLKFFIRYGSLEPPSYDFSLIRSKIKIFFGDKDSLVNELDVGLLEQCLVNAKELEVTCKHGYTHKSFNIARDVDEFYDEILDKLEQGKA